MGSNPNKLRCVLSALFTYTFKDIFKKKIYYEHPRAINIPFLKTAFIKDVFFLVHSSNVNSVSTFSK